MSVARPFQQLGPKRAQVPTLRFSGETAIVIMLLAPFALAMLRQDLSVTATAADFKWTGFGLFFLLAVLADRKAQPSASSWAHLCFLVFILVAGVRTLVGGGEIDDAVSRVASFMALYLIAFRHPFPDDAANRIAVWTSAILCISAVLLGAAAIWPDTRAGRLSGITYGPNTLGTIAATVCVGALAGALGGGVRRLWLLLPAAAAAFALAMTGSRSAAFGCASGCLTAIGVAASKPVRWVCLALLGFLIFSFVTAESGTLPAGPLRLLDRPLDLASRRYQWTSQMDAWLEAPFFGSGLQRIRESRGGGRAGGEGSYLDLLGIAGIAGGAPIIVGFAACAIRLVRHARAARRTRAPTASLAATATAIVVSILINSIGEGYMAAVGSMQGIYVWVLCGVACELLGFRSVLEDSGLPRPSGGSATAMRRAPRLFTSTSFAGRGCGATLQWAPGDPKPSPYR